MTIPVLFETVFIYFIHTYFHIRSMNNTHIIKETLSYVDLFLLLALDTNYNDIMESTTNYELETFLGKIMEYRSFKNSFFNYRKKEFT